jgi:hypothetical protein
MKRLPLILGLAVSCTHPKPKGVSGPPPPSSYRQDGGIQCEALLLTLPGFCPADAAEVVTCERDDAVAHVAHESGQQWLICFEGSGAQRCTVRYRDCRGWHRFDFGEHVVE